MTARDEARAIVAALRAAREARGWSPERVALEVAVSEQRAVVSRMSIRRYEGGEMMPPLDVVVAWARAVGVPFVAERSTEACHASVPQT